MPTAFAASWRPTSRPCADTYPYSCRYITIAVGVLVAAKAGDDVALETSPHAWYANAREIADFLHAANPDHWARKEMRSMMRMHLDLTLEEAAARLAGDYGADVAAYDEVVTEIAEMSHMLARGIVLQFPQRSPEDHTARSRPYAPGRDLLARSPSTS